MTTPTKRSAMQSFDAEEAQRLDIFYGDTTESMSQVYVRISGLNYSTETSLSGFVRGPQCAHSQTLPSTIPLSDLGPGNTVLARADILDPSFWSPDVPSMYEAEVRLCRGDEVKVARRYFGIRRFGPSGRNLYFNGKRCVLRGIWRHEAPEDDLTRWRAERATMFVEQPDDKLCENASRLGVLLAARLHGSTRDIEKQLRQLARWPAVGIAIINTNLRFETDVRDIAPNIYLAQMVVDVRRAEPAPWASLLVGQADSLEKSACQVAEVELPIIAIRNYDELSSIDQLRPLCDKLQRDLNPYGDFAGYVV